MNNATVAIIAKNAGMEDAGINEEGQQMWIGTSQQRQKYERQLEIHAQYLINE